ncbi:MAG: M36 family metallopeptidase [Blastocatellia bacterium]
MDVTASPQLDGDLNQGVIDYELTASVIAVGNGSGLGGLQSGGMGEGWSGYFGLALLAKASDSVDGKYPVRQ